MKTLRLALLPLLLCLFVTSCAHPSKDGPFLGDKLIYAAETAIGQANGFFVSYMQWERRNTVALAAWPEVKRSADFVRANNRVWLGEARTALEAYRSHVIARRALEGVPGSNPPPVSAGEALKRKLREALSLLDSYVTQAQTYMAAHPVK